MLGKPLYDYFDIVKFNLIDEDNSIIICVGEICVVDKYGTFEQNKEPSYDIMVENWKNTGTKMFVKHVLESDIELITKSKDNSLDPNWRFNSNKKY